MVDIHSHILPETDDGARSWEIAVEMCQMAARDGITHMVATPHSNDEYSYERARHEATLDRLRAQLDGALTLSLGCDFHFSFENIQDALVHPHRYTIGSSDYLLIELHDYSIPPAMEALLAKIGSIGLRPILTHPERNSILQRRPEMVLPWVFNGCIVQVTANVLTGRWGDRALKAAQYLFKHNAVHVLASDAHDIKSRPPILSQGRTVAEKLVGREVAQILVEDNPAAIVSNKPLPYFPMPTKK